MAIDTAGSLTENLIACIEALGAARPQSKGLSELYQSLATALQSFSGGYPLSTPQSSGQYATNTALVANTTTTIFTTPSLAIGTWLITYQLTIDAASTLSIPTSFVALGTATATFAGKYSATTGNATSLVVGGFYELNCNFLAIVTVAGTVLLQAKSNETDSVIGTVGALTSGVSGYTATRVA